VIEDDYDGEIHFGDRRSEPLLALDRTGQVIHIGSLSRLLAPGLRLGYLVLPEPLVPFLARVKLSREEQGDPAFEWAVADLIRDGELTRHVRRTRKVYEVRRDCLVSLLWERLGAHLDLAPPEGGMGLWIRARAGVDAEGWVRGARQAGLILNPPSHFFLDGAQPAFRMGFAQANETELGEAVERLVKAMPRGSARG
jgi:GntR family transcriptional regulator/MocR family aminotransferase